MNRFGAKVVLSFCSRCDYHYPHQESATDHQYGFIKQQKGDHSRDDNPQGDQTMPKVSYCQMNQPGGDDGYDRKKQRNTGRNLIESPELEYRAISTHADKKSHSKQECPEIRQFEVNKNQNDSSRESNARACLHSVNLSVKLIIQFDEEKC